MNSVILANADTLRAVSQYMNHPIALRGGGIMLLAALSLAAFWVAMTYWENYRKKTELAQQTPTALFTELCRVHDLTREQIHLLQMCTHDHHELPVLFVDPTFLETFAKNHPAHTPGALRLRDILFGHHPSAQA